MENKIKTAVFGVGSLGQHHARVHAEHELTELVGVYDISKKRANEIAKKFGCKAFTSVEELASLVDAASVAVPTDRHHEMATQLLELGVNLLIEKPIAASTEEAEEIVHMAEEKDLILQVGHIERFNPVIKYIEKKLDNPRFIEALRMSKFPPPRLGLLPRGTEVSVVLDLMIHDLDIILHIVQSPVVHIHAVGVPVLSKSEDIANVRLNFENGTVANITASRVSREALRKIRVFQSNGYLSLDYNNRTGVIIKKQKIGINTKKIELPDCDQLTDEIDSFVRCVKEQSSPIVGGRPALDALSLATQICECIKNNPS